MARIVVGIDGSDASRVALSWAVDEARLRGAEVDAVHAWDLPIFGYTSRWVTPPDVAREELESDARKLLDEVCDSVDGRDVVVNRIVAEGPPARCLLESAKGADLLVVGSRGRGGFAGLLLGSVSQQCAQHAPCPVVIIH